MVAAPAVTATIGKSLAIDFTICGRPLFALRCNHKEVLQARKQTAVIGFMLTKYGTKLISRTTPKVQPSKSNMAIRNDSAVATRADTAKRRRARTASGLTVADL
ncbi:MAG: hypothetical protein WAM58_07815 [Candidatus Acidiferrum sp.]